MTNPPYSIDQAVKRFNLVSDGYKTELIDKDPIKRAIKLARAYQRSVNLFTGMDTEKIALWRAIQERIDASDDGRGRELFNVSTAKTILGVNAPSDYSGDWWDDCGVSYGYEDIIDKLLDPLGKKDSQTTADQAAEKVSKNEWEVKSQYVKFGRKIIVLERAMEVFATELRLYVLFGGGEMSAISPPTATYGTRRNYEQVRYLIGKDIAKKNQSIGATPSVFVESENYIKSPPPSPFLAALQDKSFDKQVRIVNGITRLLGMSTAGRKFLAQCGADYAPWQVSGEEKTEEFWASEVGGTAPDWLSGNVTTIRKIERVVKCNSGFNLLALIENPERKNKDGKLVSRAAEPGQRWSGAAGTGQVKWLRWDEKAQKFKEPSQNLEGTIFRYGGRQDATYNGGKRYFKKNDWQVKNNAGGKRLTAIANRLLAGGANIAGRNAKKSGSDDPSPSLKGLEYENEHARKNNCTQLGVVFNLLATGVGKGASASQYVVDYFEDTGEKIATDGNNFTVDDTKVYKWVKNNDTLSDIGNKIGEDWVERAKAGVPITFSAGFVLLTTVNALALEDQKFGVGDALTTTDLVVQSFDTWGDVGQSTFKNALEGVEEQTVDVWFEAAGAALGMAEAVWNGWQAYSLGSKGNTYKAGAVGGLAVLGAIQSVAGWVAAAGTVQPWLYIVSAICVVGSLLIAILAASFSWSKLENWLDYCYFGIERPNTPGKKPQKPNPAGPWGDHKEETTNPGGEYYGFEDDYSRQLSYFKSVPQAGSVNECYVYYADDGVQKDFVIDIKDIKGVTENSELIVCALPDNGKELWPLFTFPMDASKNGQFFDNTTMPNGMKFNKKDTMNIDTYVTPTSGNRFKIECSFGKKLQTNQNSGGQSKVNEFFEDYFMSKGAAEEYGGVDYSPKDWGWEILYYPTRLRDDFRSALKKASRGGKPSENKDPRKMLFSIGVARKRIQLQIPNLPPNYWGFESEVP